MKKLILLFASISFFTAFSGAQPSLPTNFFKGASYGYKKGEKVGMPKVVPDQTGWKVIDISQNLIPRVTWSFCDILTSTGTILITNYGGDISPDVRQDRLTYVYQPLSTTASKAYYNVFNVEISNNFGESVAKGESVVKGGTVGLMLRTSLDPDSAYVMMAFTNENGAELNYRDSKGGYSRRKVVFSSTGSTPPIVQLTRFADWISGSISYNNGKSWIPFGDVLFPDAPLYVGFAVASNNWVNSSNPKNIDSNNNRLKQWQFGELNGFWQKTK